MFDRHTDTTALRRLLAKRDMSLVALANKAGLTYSQVKKVAIGQRDLSDRAAVRVARALGCEVEDFTRPGRKQVAA